MTRVPTLLLKALVVFPLVLSCATAGAEPGAGGEPENVEGPAAAGGGSFVWLSDVHFTPFYPYAWSSQRDESEIREMLCRLVDGSGDRPTWKDHGEWGAVFAASPLQADVYSARGDDANDRVLQAVLDRAAAEASDPDFILITGDLLGHGFGTDYSSLVPAVGRQPACQALAGDEGALQTAEAYRRFVAETLDYIALSARRRFKAPIVATLGNNDAYCGDYDLRLDQGGSAFLADSADTFLRYFLPDLTASEKQAFRETFEKGGYYTAAVPGGGGSRILVLNSVTFMDKYPCQGCDTCGAACGDFPGSEASCAAQPTVDAAAQLAWLASEAAASGRAWVATHVPPGTGCYDDAAYWASVHLDGYRRLFLAGDTAANLAGTLSAHSHMASFKLLRDDAGDAVSFVLQAPSISPNHDNNPTFGLLEYDPSTLEIRGYRVWYLDLDRTGTTWSHYDFAGLSGAVTASSLDALYSRLATDATAWSTFADDYGARAPRCSDSLHSGCVSLGKLGQDHLACLDDLLPPTPPGG